jgi:ribonucleoside-diphosphate reductase beta chain
MTQTIFNRELVNHLEEPMFFGSSLNVARTETVKHTSIANLTDTQIGFFWRPTEINLSKDIIDFQNMPEHEQHMFLANLKYQTLLDSIQGRAPTLAFLPICSDPALERWIETWSFFETIHSESYSHIVRTILPTDMSETFDSIVQTEEIMARADSIGKYYDNLIRYNNLRAVNSSEYNEYEHKKALYLCMHVVNALEAIRFYVSFAVTFSFGERKLLDGNCKIMTLIARDEALHLKGTQMIINNWQNGVDGQEWVNISKECEEEANNIFKLAAEQEKDWATYLTKLGTVVGLNKQILDKYVEYITAHRMSIVGLKECPYPRTKNPIPWMNNWLKSDNKQVAPQETEISSYITGGINTDININSLQNSLKELVK